MKILVIGKTGQVATAIANVASNFPHHSIVFLGRPELDLSDSKTIADDVADVGADVVVNAAAYTMVDAAEADEDNAYQINAVAAGQIAAGAARKGAWIIQLSTDYVFDGLSAISYKEGDATSPTGAYGRTKLAGEQAVASANPKHIIARTAWVYSPFGNNFVKTMLRLGETRDVLKVVDDQIGNPTSALDIASTILALSDQLEGRCDDLAGIYHLSGSGISTWCGFAQEIFDIAAGHGKKTPTVNAIATKDYPTPAKRPPNSRLDCYKLQEAFGLSLPYWRDSTVRVVSDILTQKT